MNDPLPNFDSPEQTDDENTRLHEAARVPSESSLIGINHAPWFGGKSDCGKVRENNEDQFSMHNERNLFIVADGMGGHAAGEVASLIVVEALQHRLTSQVIAAAIVALRLEDEIAEALRGANTAVMKASEDHPEWSGMGSTAVVALLHGRTLYIANVGDSRAYLLRSGVLHVLSQDHSIAAALARQNHISREEIRTHPLRNRLTVCLGIEDRIEPYTNRMVLQHGDRVLLCSDGLWDMLTDQEITQLWSEHADAEQAAQALVAAANGAGGQDNITVIVLNIGDREEFLISTECPAADSSDSLEDTVVVAC